MQRKRLVKRNIKFIKNTLRIYILVVLIFFSTINNGFITNIILADSYGGPDYYVNGTFGDDSNDGSFNSPFKTIQKAINVSTNGDTIYVMTGTYLPSTGRINIDNKNIADEWLTIRNYNNDYVIIDGTNCPHGPDDVGGAYINATIEMTNSKYVRITGITVNHSAAGGITLRSTPISFIRIDNCTISNCSSFAFKVNNNMNNITFEYNYVYNNFNHWSNHLMSQETISFENVDTFSINNNRIINNRAENIDMKGGCEHGEVCYNEINTTAGYVWKVYANWGGLGVYIDSRGISHNISIYNNLIYGNVSGISINTETTGHYENISIYNNVVNITNENGDAITSNGRIPLEIGLSGSSTDVFKDIYVYSNTFRTGSNLDTVAGIVYVDAELTSSNLKNVHIINNIFYTDYITSNNLPFIKINSITFEQGIFTIKNNSFYRSSNPIYIYWNGVLYSSTANPEKFGNYPVFTNPLFVDIYNGDFHLNSESPCIDVGNNILVPSFDFEDVSRPQGSGYEIGAYEFLSSYDNTPPQISYISILTSNPLDTEVNFGWENFSCIVTDNVGVYTVFLQITYPNETTTNVLMAKKTGSNTYYSNLSYSLAGDYSYIIQANDTSNNVALSSNNIFSLPPNWDINNDGVCSILDLLLVSNHYNEIGANGWLREDFDNNGVINILDMSLVSNHYDESW